MKRTGWWVVLVAALGVGNAMAIVEVEYEVVLQEPDFEVRRYEPHLFAETIVDGDLDVNGDGTLSKPILKTGG